MYSQGMLFTIMELIVNPTNVCNITELSDVTSP